MLLLWYKARFFGRIELLLGEGYILQGFNICSSWSRWLFALLSESSKQEVVSLDMFSAPAFSMVLEYMYGRPLYFSLEVKSFLRLC